MVWNVIYRSKMKAVQMDNFWGMLGVRIDKIKDMMELSGVRGGGIK